MDFDFNSYNTRVILITAAWSLLGLALFCGLASFCYACLWIPLRRLERARVLLALIESTLKDGGRLEEMMVSISNSRESSLGAYFHLFAAHLAQGLPFNQALDTVPSILPAPVVAMLKAGNQIGDIGKVVPACRQKLNDAISRTRGAVNYLVMLAFAVTPLSVAVLSHNALVILPIFKAVATNMNVPMPGAVQMITGHTLLFVLSQLLLLFTVWFVAFLYIDGQRSNPRARAVLGGMPDRLHYALPWRRKRMQRDFSTMLAVLLDSGVPESDALELAGDCAANEIFQRRVTRARTALQQGLKLAQAVEMIDDSGEFRWRLSQAVARQRGFVEAIAGWREALDAKAYQQEQATAQVATTALVLLNGVFVAVIALSVFGVLISIINAGLLW